MTNTYKSASIPFQAFHVSVEDAEKIFTDNRRWNCKDCFEIMHKVEYHDGRVIISNVEGEGLHLVGLSNK